MPARRREEAGCHAGPPPGAGALALRSVKFRAVGATALLRLNLLLYGLGGLIMPFVGFKLIGLIVHNLLGA